MKTPRLEDALSECLTLLSAGASLDECLSRYPMHAQELRQQLATARALSEAPVAVAPDATAQARGRARLLHDVEQHGRRAAPGGASPLGFLGAALRRWAVVPYALPAVAAMLLLGGAAWGVSAATGSAGPGGWLFGSSSDDREQFRGTIVAIGPASVTVATGSGEVTALITPETKFEGRSGGAATLADFAPGDAVRLRAFLAADGALVARELEHEGHDAPRTELRDGECELRGVISSLNPLVVNDVTVDLSAVERVRVDIGQAFEQGTRVRVRGDLVTTADTRTCRAREVRADDDQLTRTPVAGDDGAPRTELRDGECELRGMITGLDPLVVNGVTVDLSAVERLRVDIGRAFEQGARVRVRGDLITTADARTCRAREVRLDDDVATPAPGADPTATPARADDNETRTELRDGECELRGVISSLNPLVVNGVTVDLSAVERVRIDVGQAFAAGTRVRVKGELVVTGGVQVCRAEEVRADD